MEPDPNIDVPREGDDWPEEGPPDANVVAEQSLLDLERELVEHEAAATSLRRRIAELAPAVSESFRELLCTQDNIDEYLARDDFDPEVFMSHFRHKVDRLRYMVEDLMKSRAEGLAATALPIQHKAQAIKRNRERLRDTIVKTMQEHHFQRVPGINFAVRLRDNSNESLKWDPADREYRVTVDDYERFPGYVKRTTVYSWNTDRIREDLKAGNPLPTVVASVAISEDENGAVFGDQQVTIPARFERGQWPEFVVNVPEKLAPKKRGKKK